MAKKHVGRSGDLEARVAALEEVIDHLRATQPHLMPSSDQPAAPEPGPETDTGEIDTSDSHSWSGRQE